MKTLIALLLLTVVACAEDPPGTRLAASFGPASPGDPALFEADNYAAIGVKESIAGCPDKYNPDCEVFDTARGAWGMVEETCDTYDEGGACAGSEEFPEASPESLIWFSCVRDTYGTSNCACTFFIGNYLIGFYADFGCNGSANWIDPDPGSPTLPVCHYVPCCSPDSVGCG